MFSIFYTSKIHSSNSNISTIDDHTCVRKDNISKMESEVTIGSVHRFFRSLNEKPKTEPNKVGLD